MGRTVNGATSPDTPQRRNSIVKHVFRNDKSSFAVFRSLLGVYTDRRFTILMTAKEQPHLVRYLVRYGRCMFIHWPVRPAWPVRGLYGPQLKTYPHFRTKLQ